MREVVIVDGVRTPIGRSNKDGYFKDVRADDLAVMCMRRLLERNRKLTPGASHRPEPKLWSRSPVPSRFALEVRMPRMSAGAPASRPARAGSMSAPEG